MVCSVARAGPSDGTLDPKTTEALFAELQPNLHPSLTAFCLFSPLSLPVLPAARLAAGPSGGALDPEAEERRKRDEEEAARAAARAHGTPVTVEAFEAWRKKFEAEQALAKVQLGEGGKADGAAVAAGRITGKAWFLAQMAAGKEVSSNEEEEDGEEDAYEVEVSAFALFLRMLLFCCIRLHGLLWWCCTHSRGKGL
jgi:hypothetical protein